MSRWLSGEYVGDARPMMRATIQKLSMLEVPVGDQVYAAAVFGQTDRPAELPNLKSVEWSRSTSQDAATCTLVLYNTIPLPLGQVPERDEELDVPGFYTFNRGTTSWSTSRWGHTANGWRDRIVPDRIIRTYEGYGFDPDVSPEDDPDMYLSGVWKIDDVEYTHDGLITIKCRDLGSLLIEQIMFPPVVPFKHYPLRFSPYRTVNDPPTVVTTGSTIWKRPSYDTDSNRPYVGNGSVYGHHGTDAFDTSTSTYWMSIGNATPDQPYAYEFIQGKFAAGTLSAVKFRVWGGPYRVYISVKTASGWKGTQTVPYDPNNPASAPNGADIPFLYSFKVTKEQDVSYKLPTAVAGATHVRITFHNLYNSGIGQFPYRAGMRDVQVAIGTTTSTSIPQSHTEGDYGDYTEIVKRLCCYGGLYWPIDPNLAFFTETDGDVTTLVPASSDPYIVTGRAWGDFENTGTFGPADLDETIWDKKPLMDGITYVKDIVGFIFFIDETGGAVFRSPNIWSVGNYIGDGGPNAGRTSEVITIDERQTMIGLTASLSSRNIREKVFVANVNGRLGAVVKGHNPYPSNLRRVAGWTDQHFETQEECIVMADLITLRQLFTYRTDTVVIAGNPAIQIDDQVRLYERVTNEGYLQYVDGISSSWDLETGEWTYQLSTHWLGDAPFGSWVFDPANLDPATQQYLQTLGKI